MEALKEKRKKGELNKGSSRELFISVIVPTLNEEAYLAQTLEVFSADRNHEIIVVDGGSWDQTKSIAHTYADRVLSTARGRAVQMNAGARAARGDLLLFLHADSRLRPGALECLRQAVCEDVFVVGGGFSLKLAGAGLKFRCMASMSTFRARRLGWIYGDQAIFVRRSVFEEIGGYREMPIMEDFDLAYRLRKRGKMVVLEEAVLSSARQWEEGGFLRTVVMYWALLTGYLLGLSPKRLARWAERFKRRNIKGRVTCQK